MPPEKRVRTVNTSDAPKEERYLYQLYYSTDYTTSWDTAWHDQSELDVLQDTYATIDEANAAAENRLLEEFDREAYDEEYTVTKDSDGLVRVHAVGMEGTTFDVYIKRVPATKKATELENDSAVYVVYREDKVNSVHASLAGANSAIERLMEEGAWEELEENEDGLMAGGTEDGKIIVKGERFFLLV